VDYIFGDGGNDTALASDRDNSGNSAVTDILTSIENQ
jgi:hypothetical protein